MIFLGSAMIFLAACQHKERAQQKPPAPVAARPPASQPPAPQPPAGIQQIAQAQPTLPTVTAPATPLADNEKKLDTTLLEIVRTARAGGSDAAAKSLSTRRNLDVKGQKVKVEIVAKEKSALPDLKKQVTRAGGEVTAELENHMWAYLPPAAIEPLSRTAQVWSMSASIATNTEKK